MNLARTRYVIGQPGLKAISLLVLLKKFPGSYFFKTLFQLPPCNFTRNRISNKFFLGIFVNCSFVILEHRRMADSTRKLRKRYLKEKALEFEQLFLGPLLKLVTEGWKLLA